MGDEATTSESELPAWRWGCAVWFYGAALALFALLAASLTDYLDPVGVLNVAFAVVLVPLLTAVATSVNRRRSRAAKVVVSSAVVVVLGFSVVAHQLGPDRARGALESIRVPSSLRFSHASENTSIGGVEVYFSRSYTYDGGDPVGVLHDLESELKRTGYRVVAIDDDPSNLGPNGLGLSLAVRGGEGTVTVSVTKERANNRYRVAITLRP